MEMKLLLVRLFLLLIVIVIMGFTFQENRFSSLEAVLTAPSPSATMSTSSTGMGTGVEDTPQPARATSSPSPAGQTPQALTAGTATPAKLSSSPTATPNDPQAGKCKWTSVFSDNFDGNQLDLTKWNPDYPAGKKEWQHYVGDAFEVKDGILRIRAEKRSLDGRNYTSGIITTQGIFDQKYGWFEIRAKVPHGKGLWPAFWLLPSNKNYPYEIDVFEILGDDTHTVYMSNHWPDDQNKHVYETKKYTGPDYSSDFHIYAVDWKPDRITWKVDGVERAWTETGLPYDPMFLLVNLAVGGEWPGYPDGSTQFPSYLEVDYVKVVAEVCP